MARFFAVRKNCCAAMQTAEIIAIPHYALVGETPDAAKAHTQAFFNQMLAGLYRRCEREQTSIELLFVSTEVSNQTYNAQVEIYLTIRRMCADAAEACMFVDNMMASIRSEMESHDYVLQVLDDTGDEKLQSLLRSVNYPTVLAVSKCERYINFGQGGLVYFTDTLHPSEMSNIALLSNMLTQYPNSAVLIQLIPTDYTAAEIAAIEKTKNWLNYTVNQMRFGMGLKIDTHVQSIVEAYDYYSQSEADQLVYFNYLVFAQNNAAHDLANRIITVCEADDKQKVSALEITDLSEHPLSLCERREVSPWLFSNLLVFSARERTFWDAQEAPQVMRRLKYLETVREANSIFKLPIDDGETVSMESKRVRDNKEKLHGSVLAKDGFKVGVIQNATRSVEEVHAGIPLNDFTKHGLIVGMPGSGKTNFSLGLLLQFWQDFHIPFLAIEPTKSEYRSLLDAIPELQIFTPGKSNVSPYIINPFVPPRGVTVETYVPSLMSAFKAAFSMPEPLPNLFLSAINECYNEYGWKSSSTSDDPYAARFGMYEFIKIFKNKMQHMNYKGDVKANMESAGTVRLISLIEQNSNIYDNIHTIPLDDLLRSPTVIELNAINNKEQKSLIMALLLIMICVYTKNNVAGDGKLKNVLLIDEAHVLLSGVGGARDGAADSQSATVETVEDLIAEIRSYGTSIIIADQSPIKVGRSIVANTNVKLLFKLVERENKEMIRDAIGMSSEDSELLVRLGVGEAVLHYGRLNAPLHIKAYDVQKKARIRAVIPDAEVAQKMTYWNTRQELLIPHRECKYNSCCHGSCSEKIKSDADFVAIHLINHLLYTVQEKAEFIHLLGGLNRYIQTFISDTPGLTDSVRLRNCAKIKFLRKALLVKTFGLLSKEYEQILLHPDFLLDEVIPKSKPQ